MEAELIIHCLGLEGLTVTVFGADHSIPLTTDVLRVTTFLGSIEYTVAQLPVTYNTADLHGNLTISDSSGKALYRWRLHSTAQPSAAGHWQSKSLLTNSSGSETRSPSISAPPSSRTAETPLTSRSNKALDEPTNCRNASAAAEAIVESPDGKPPFVLLYKTT